MSAHSADVHYMQRAIELAKQGRFTTTPNPNVGCVIVKNGRIIGEGYHQQAGTPHAEVHALRDAGTHAQGATAYVTLEPCSHTGRTGPCAQALINAKVAKVVCAMQDPNPKVGGQGFNMLRDAGIEVVVGVCNAQSEAINRGFLKRMRQQRPFVTCKLAASIDGKTALENGESKWITGEQARADVQLLRAQHCAILSGADTVLIDNAKLTVRLTEQQQSHFYPSLPVRQPIRVILDSQYRLTPDLALFKQGGDIIIVRSRTNPVPAIDKAFTWPNNVTEVYIDGQENGQVNLAKLMDELSARQCNYVFVEAGAKLAGALSAQQLIDEYIIYLAPKLMGHSARSLINIGPFATMQKVPNFIFSDITQVGEDVRLSLVPNTVG